MSKNKINATIGVLTSRDEIELILLKQIDQQIEVFENLFDRRHEVRNSHAVCPLSVYCMCVCESV